jgi:hypothetical protein
MIPTRMVVFSLAASAVLLSQQLGSPAATGTSQSPAVLASDMWGLRTVYLTGGKPNAISHGKSDLRFWTCLSAVDEPSQADLIVDLEYSDVRLIQAHRDGVATVVSCTSTRDGVRCLDSNGHSSGVTCGSNKRGDVTCSTYDDKVVIDAIRDLSAAGMYALERKMYTRAFVMDKQKQNLLWQYDEYAPTKGIPAMQQFWWAQLNAAVGCGKTHRDYKKWAVKHPEGNDH